MFSGIEKMATFAPALSFRAGMLWGGSLGLGLLAWLLAPGADVPPFIYFQF